MEYYLAVDIGASSGRHVLGSVEGGRLKLPSGEAEREYIRTYCADHLGWRRCTISRAITRFYEVEEERDQ